MFFIFCGTVVCFFCSILCVREISTEDNTINVEMDPESEVQVREEMKRYQWLLCWRTCMMLLWCRHVEGGERSSVIHKR